MNKGIDYIFGGLAALLMVWLGIPIYAVACGIIAGGLLIIYLDNLNR